MLLVCVANKIMSTFVCAFAGCRFFVITKNSLGLPTCLLKHLYRAKKEVAEIHLGDWFVIEKANVWCGLGIDREAVFGIAHVID